MTSVRAFIGACLAVFPLSICAGLSACSDSARPPSEDEPTTAVSPDPSALAVRPHPEGFVLAVHGGNLIGRHFATLEEAGFYGNGPAWLGVLEHLAAQAPELRLTNADDESDAARVFAREHKTLETLRRRLLTATKDELSLVQTFRAARAEGRAPGDL